MDAEEAMVKIRDATCRGCDSPDCAFISCPSKSEASEVAEAIREHERGIIARLVELAMVRGGVKMAFDSSAKTYGEIQDDVIKTIKGEK